MVKEVAEKTRPSLWKRIVARVRRGGKYGEPDSWNARKAQYAVKLYKEEGGSYNGRKTRRNSLVKWTKQDWSYSSEDSRGKGRYLPSKVWKKLTPSEKEKENQKKREANRRGQKKAVYSKKVARLVRKI